MNSNDYDLFLKEEGGHRVSKKRKTGKKDTSSGWYYLGFIGEVGFTIAIPIAGGAIIGAYLDRIWGTYPKATLSFLFIGIAVSLVGFVRVVQDIIRKS